MKNLFLIAVFAMVSSLSYAHEVIIINENGDTTKPIHKEVRVETEIENGQETTRVWVDGKEVKEGSDEYKKYSEGEMMTGGKMRIKKRKNKNGEAEKMIIIKEEMTEDVIISSDEDMEIDVDVEEDGDNHKVIIRKKTKDGKVEVKEIIVNENDDNNVTMDGDTKIIIKTKKVMDLDLEGIDEDDIETIDVNKTDKGKTITIKMKDGETIVREIEGGNDEDVKVIKKRIKTNRTENFDFDLDGLDPENIKTIDVDKTKDGQSIIIKTKDGKTIVKKINGNNVDVKVIKKEKKEKN